MQAPYLLLPIGILTTLLYLFSHILVRLGVWSKSSHRKLWNVILFLTFLTTAVIGLLLVIQINYKLEWEAIDTLLTWHVDIGIALSFVATFHLIWHFSYFLNLFKQKSAIRKEESINKVIAETEIRDMRLLIFLSGFISTVIQVLLIREITTVFQGNEFMMGWTIGIWMLLTGTGAYLGRNYNASKTSLHLLRNIIVMICVFPLVLVVLLNLLKNIIFPPGMLVSPLSFLLLCLLMLAPICLLAGFLFSLFISFQKSEKKGFIRVYALEATGSIAGGIVVSFLFINWLTILQSFSILLFIVCSVVYILHRRKTILILLSITVTLVFVLIFSPLENKIKSFLFLNQTILESKETFYGNITVTGNAGAYNFFSNGSLIFSSENFILREEYVHYALLQCRQPVQVLLLSGRISGMVEEVLKYPSVESVDCIELNPKLIGLGLKYELLPEDSRVHIIYGDGKRYISMTEKRYDAVIMAIPDPSSLQVNRYYTTEFLADLKEQLKANAVVLYGISSTGNYLSEVQANKLTVLLNTLKLHFNYVEILPGEKDYLLASDAPISLAISSLYSLSSIENIYVNSDYIDDASIQMRSNFIVQSLPKNRTINTNNHPLPVFFDTMRFVSQFYADNKWIIYFPLFLLLLPLFFMKPESTGMYTAGLSGASIEILLIFAFQIIYGYVYSAIGLIVAIFMGGLATGSLLGYRLKVSKLHFPLIQLCLMLFLLILPFILNLYDQQINPSVLWPVFVLITFIPSALVGYFYVVATTLHATDSAKAAPAVYAADLLGSSLGIIAATILLVPLIGINSSCYLLAAFNLLGAIYYLIRKRFFS